jgi:hypothetical protein
MALRRKAKATFIACLFLVFAFQEMCEAAEWWATPSIMVRRDYDDNVQLSTKPVPSVSSNWVAPRLDFGIASKIWNVYGGAAFTSRRFPGNSELDSDAQYLSVGTSYKAERNLWQLNAASSKTSYFAAQVPSSDVVLFTQNTDTDTNNISPTWTWLITELTRLQLTYSVSDVSYVNGESVGLYDYRNSSLSAKLGYHLDIDTEIFLLPDYSLFRTTGTSSESRTTSYQVGIARNFSETMIGSLSVGGRDTSSEREVLVCKLFLGPFCLQTGKETISSRDSGSVYSANLEMQFQTVHLTAAASRSYEPSANSQLVITDSASFNLSRPFKPKLTGKLDILAYNYNYRNSSQTVGVSNGNDHKLYYIRPSLGWQWAPEWNLDAGYRYTYAQRVSETSAATSNVAFIMLTYRWPKISISR